MIETAERISSISSISEAFHGDNLIYLGIPAIISAFCLTISFVVGFYKKHMVDISNILFSNYIIILFFIKSIIPFIAFPNFYYFFKGLYEGNHNFPGVRISGDHVPSPPGHPDHGGILDTLGVDTLSSILLFTFVSIGFSLIFVLFLILVFDNEIMRRDNRREAIENEKKWEEQIKRFNEIMIDYAERENDPNTMLTIPMIREVKAKMVQDFHASKEEVNEIISQGYKDNAEELTTAVNNLDSSWTQLLDKAKEVGTPGLSSVDMNNARKALSMMMDESLSLRERRKYQDQLNEIMSKSVNKDGASGNRILSSIHNVLGKIRI